MAHQSNNWIFTHASDDGTSSRKFEYYPVGCKCENAGFDMIASMENRYDPFLPLAVSAVSTKKIKLAAVAICFPRSPMVMANTCWDLQKASKGRFVLGIGPQIKPHRETIFGSVDATST